MLKATPFRLSVLTSAVLMVSACGGDGNGSTIADDTSTVSGTVQSSGGESLSQSDWLDTGHNLLASLMPAAMAEITGIGPTPNTPVSLIRIDSQGNQVEELASTTTDDNGEFTLETTASIDDSSVIVRAGTGDDAIRGPAREQTEVDPITEAVVQEAVKRVSSGESSFEDFSPDEVAAAADQVEETLDANDADLSEGVDTEQFGDDIAANVDAATNDEAGEFVGDKNSISIGVRPQASGDSAQVDILAGVSNPTVTEQGNLDFAGSDEELRRISRIWEDFGSNDGPSGSLDSARETGTVSSDESALDTLLRDDGTFAATDADGTGLRGIRSGDGDFHAIVTGDRRLVVGAEEASVSAADLDGRTYNLVSLSYYLVEDASQGFSDGQVGVETTVWGNSLATIGLACSDGACDVTLNRGIGTDRDFVQGGPKTGQTVFAGGSNNTDSNDTFTLDSVAVDSSGRLAEEDATQGETRGFVAPNGDMLAFFFSSDDPAVDSFSNGFPFANLFVGLPQGAQCDNGTIQGTYNAVRLGNEFRTESVNTPTQTDIFHRTTTITVDADGQGGLSFSNRRVRDSRLDFNNGMAAMATDVRDEGQDPTTYAVNRDCTVSVVPTSADRWKGVVSPDGEVVILADSDVDGDTSDWQGLTIAIRQPGS